MNTMKVGLVLSGGGAKGAYQAGVIKALYELGTQVDVIAGASIGALNGAILAAAPSLQDGALRLEQLWTDLAESSPLRPNYPAYLQFLAASGLNLAGASMLSQLATKMQIIGRGQMPSWLHARLSSFLGQLNSGAISDTPLQQHMNRYLDQDSLNKGLPLYVSVHKHDQALLDLLRCVVAEAGIADTRAAEFLHIQSLPLLQQKEALLASAAIPLFFAPKKVNDTLYSDGGLGGWQMMQGNTPIAPLLEAGCNMVIVTHLSEGSLWRRSDFPGVTILEIRPQSNISREGFVPDIVDFHAEKIPSWINQGYADTMRCIGRVKKISKTRAALKISEAMVIKSQKDSLLSDLGLMKAMDRLDS